MARILIADEDASFARALSSELRPRNWSVESVAEAGKALALVGSKHYDVAVLDWGKGSGHGLELLREVRARGMGVAVVMLSARAGFEEAVEAIKAGAQELVRKPVDPASLSQTLAELCERQCPSTHVLADRVDLFIQENCACRELDLRRLCERFRISQRYIGKLLVRYMGGSFRQRLLHFRLEKAKKLIESTDLPLYTVAERCGFGSPSLLSAAFQRHEGLPPRRYRTMNRG